MRSDVFGKTEMVIYGLVPLMVVLISTSPIRFGLKPLHPPLRKMMFWDTALSYLFFKTKMGRYG